MTKKIDQILFAVVIFLAAFLLHSAMNNSAHTTTGQQGRIVEVSHQKNM
ncbi:MAG: hypothetical protein Q3M24_11245 [Candidatus Electrothrix aestuarii]|uniref:Uncharacterized protein n=1 Tax=Candidatus Electrothrix aestuarii TaxID=3062594 RepID=A0AAU8M2F6_9BACT|nr:hypothetical protein [Candidatus Electrothrix aestuarii]WPD24218.1 MAG: hypothetical protein SD837_06590 [Candidatus Electrothrix sp. GW3-3]